MKSGEVSELTNGKYEPARSATSGTLSTQELQKRSVTAVRRTTIWAILEMFLYTRRLFRSELLVQIFPEPDQNILTSHEFSFLNVDHDCYGYPSEQAEGPAGSAHLAKRPGSIVSGGA